MPRAAMHQTTVRFGADLWAALEREAAKLGVSAAQYIRDATLTRLAYTEGVRRGREQVPALPERDRGQLRGGVLEHIDSSAAAAVRRQGRWPARATRARAGAPAEGREGVDRR